MFMPSDNVRPVLEQQTTLLKALEHFIEGISISITDWDDLVGNPDPVFFDVVNFVDRQYCNGSSYQTHQVLLGLLG